MSYSVICQKISMHNITDHFCKLRYLSILREIYYSREFQSKKVHQHTCTNWERQHLILTQALEVVSGREICLSV